MEVVDFVVHFGAGNVRVTETGVDLSEFNNMVMQLPDPERARIAAVQEFFTGNFGYNPNMFTVKIQSVWCKSRTNIFRELLPLDRTGQWIAWLASCKRRGTKPEILLIFYPKQNNLEQGGGDFQHGESSDATHSENVDIPAQYEPSLSVESEGPPPLGEADADEYEGTMQEEMLAEDEDGVAEDLDSGDEDVGNEDEVDNDEEDNVGDVPLPESWNVDTLPIPHSWDLDKSNMTAVDDGYHPAWEYRRKNVRIGVQYNTKQELREAVIEWALSTQRVFRTEVSNSRYLTMSCINIDCPARVHAHVPKYDVLWVVSDVVPHTCEISSTVQNHPNLSSTLIARLLFSEIVRKKDMTARSIQLAVKSRWKTKILYGKAWRAKQKALEMRFGTFYDAYDNAVKMVSTLRERNPGTEATVQLVKIPGHPQLAVFGRMFFSFAICIEAFKYCRPVLCIDGTFLTGKYKGVILTAIGVDGNGQIVPVAFAFVESENYDSWLWFLRLLKSGVVKDRPNVCILHDRHAGLLKAIRKLEQPDDDEQTPWTDVQSRWCMRHMGANFYSCFKSKRLMNLFKRLCNVNQQRKYEFLWERLTEFTQNQVKERRAAQATAVAAQVAAAQAAVAEDSEPVGLCDLPGIDPPGTKRKKGARIRNFEEWIEKEPPVKWSLLHDAHGARYGIMTTNLAEIYNFVLRGNRGLPLTALVEGIMHGTMNYFRDRRVEAVNHCQWYPGTPYCRKIRTYMEKKTQKARFHNVVRVGNEEARYEVRLPTDRFGDSVQRTHEVFITDGYPPTCECTCNKPRLLHLPCSHVLAVCGQLGLHAATFVSPYYMKDALVQTWTGEMRGFRLEGNFNTVEEANREIIPHPANMRTSRGRRQTRRIRNDMDESEAGGSTRQCLLCNMFGHKEKHCTKFPQGGATVRGRGTRGGRGRPNRG